MIYNDQRGLGNIESQLESVCQKSENEVWLEFYPWQRSKTYFEISPEITCELYSKKVLPWPLVTSDLNPIENLWDELKKKTCKKNQSMCNNLKIKHVKYGKTFV